jgi:plastocyanin
MTRNPVSDNQQFHAALLSALANAHALEAVQSGLTTSPGTGSWDVDYTSGQALVDGSEVSVGSGGTLTLTSADATNHRVDLITVDAAGNVTATEGSTAADPVAPDIPSNETLIAAVRVEGGTSSLDAADILDYRVLYGFDGYPLRGTDQQLSVETGEFGFSTGDFTFQDSTVNFTNTYLAGHAVPSVSFQTTRQGFNEESPSCCAKWNGWQTDGNGDYTGMEIRVNTAANQSSRARWFIYGYTVV